MKQLIVVLALAGLTFWLAKPVALRFTEPADFKRRRNVWLTLTAIAFASPNFWVFAVFAAPIYYWMGRKDSNPVAAYLLLLHVVPPVAIDMRPFGLELFDMGNYRLLAFCVLIPAAFAARRALDRKNPAYSRMTDCLLLLYGIVQIALFVPPDLPTHVILQDSPTNVLRRAFLFLVDVYALYYAVSRGCNDRRKLIDTIATICLASSIMALIATFEHFKGWVLYTELALRWSPTDMNYVLSWLLRGDSWLRAPASAGHALVLGVELAVAFGFWISVKQDSVKPRERLAVGLLFWLGMLSASARGPMIGAAVMYLVYQALKPRAISQLFKAGLAAAILLGALIMSPLGDKVMSSLQVSGAEPDPTFLYRRHLFDRSLDLIQEHPVFGDQLAMQKMEDLRQGQGIIDIVNSYVGVALFSGLIGLALFVGLLLSAVIGVFAPYRAAMTVDPDWSFLGAAIIACIFGMAFMIADCSLILGVEKMFYVLIAMAAAYTRQSAQRIRATPRPAPLKEGLAGGLVRAKHST